MSITYSPKIATDGLVLMLDASNPRSCLGGNLIKGTGNPYLSTTGWSEYGWTGSIAIDSTENALKLTSINGWHNMTYNTGITGQTMTITFEAKWSQLQSSNNYLFILNGQDLGTYTQSIGSTSSFNSTSYTKFSYTFTVTTDSKIAIGSRNQDSLGFTDIVFIKNLKVEIGSSSTTWTPSMYDRNWLDLSGYGHNADFYNGPFYNPSNSGSISFDGLGGMGIVNNTSTFTGIWDVTGVNGIPHMTIDIWVLTSDTNGGLIYSRPWNGGGQYNIRIAVSSVEIFGGTVSSTLSFGRSINNGVWTNITCWMNTFTMGYYINGNEYIGSQNHGITAGVPSSGYNVNTTALMTLYPYGTWVGNVGFSILGKAASYKVYNRVLTPTEVLNNHNATKGRFGL